MIAPFDVVFLADHDDPDVDAATAVTHSMGARVCWLKLGLSHDNYDLFVSGERAEVEGPDCTVSVDMVRSARRVVFRRWKVAPPFPIVEAAIEGDPERFAEREWEAAFRIVLGMWWESSTPSRWSRDPRPWPDKASHLRLAKNLGAAVPDYEVSTAPRLRHVTTVSKAIGLDQAVIKGQRYATTLVELPKMDYLFRGRQPCPVLLQDAVDVAHELRIGYSFGECAAVEQRKTDPDNKIADIRYAAVSRRAVPVPDDLAHLFSQFAVHAGLNVYTADVLVTAEGSNWLVDINPDGLFIAADDSRNTLATAFMDGLVSRIR